MKVVRLVMRWSLFAGFCLGVAVLTFRLVRQQPRSSFATQHGMLHVSADGTTLVTTNLEVWDIRKRKRLRDFSGSIRNLRRDGAIGPDGNPVVLVASDGLRILDWQSGQETNLPLGPNASVTNLHFSPRGRWLMARLPFDAQDLYIDVRTRKVVQRRSDTFVAFLPDDKHAVVRNHHDWDAPLTLVCLETGEPRGFIGEAFSETAVDPTGKLIALAHLHRPANAETFLTVEVWEWASRQRRFTHRLPSSAFHQMAFSADGSLLLLRSAPDNRFQSGESHVFNTDTGGIILEGPEQLSLIETPNGPILSLQGRWVPSLHEKGEVRVFDTAGNELWKQSYRPGGSMYVGPVVVARRSDQDDVRLLDLRTGRFLAAVEFEQPLSVPIKFCADGRHAVLQGVSDAQQQLRRLPRAALPAPAAEPAWKQWIQRWAPWLLPPPQDRSAVILETATGRELFRMKYATADEFWLSEDGSTVIVASLADRGARALGVTAVIRVWDVHPGRAWRWAVIAGLGMATSLLVLRWGLRIAKRRRVKQQPHLAAS
jgi:hypothetical protein